MSIVYYIVGPTSSSMLAKLNLREILIEVSDGEVCKEIGVGLNGVPVYLHPSKTNKPSFRGLFDTQHVDELIGDEITYARFHEQWDVAKELEVDGALRNKI